MVCRSHQTIIFLVCAQLTLGCSGLNPRVLNKRDRDSSSDDSKAQSKANGKKANPKGGLRRLTRNQYLNSVRDILGDVSLRTTLDADVPMLFLTNLGASTVTSTPRGVELYGEAARDLAAQGFADKVKAENFIGCKPQQPIGLINDCVDSFIKRIGMLAWRRPLSIEELATIRKVHLIVATDLNDVFKGLEAATAALLTSPYFIYRSEIGSPQTDGTRRLDAYEIAARLSFLLWNSTPDLQLLEAAEQGKLSDSTGIQEQAQRLLSSPRARTALKEFFREWLGFDSLANLGKNSTVYPQFTPTLGSAMQEEFDRVIESLVFTPEKDFTLLLNLQSTFLNAELAKLYDLTVPDGDPKAFTEIELPANSLRGSLLTMGGFLATQAKPDTTAPISRGQYILNRLLCEQVPPPPVNVPAIPPDIAGGAHRTQRQRLELHTASRGCAACHIKMDAAGLALEHFDGIGAYRDTDAGLKLDVSGAIDGQSFDGAKQLSISLQYSTRVHACTVRHLYRHALGALDGKANETRIEALRQEFTNSGFQYQKLILALVASESFTTIGDLR